MRGREWNRCEVGGCGADARSGGLFTADRGAWRLCEAHYASAAEAVGEVMGRLIATGQTYLPGSASAVLVEYAIVDSDQAESELRAFRAGAGLAAGTTPGFIGENLYRVRFDGEPDDGLRRFVNLGHWAHRAAFDAKFGTTPAIRPGPLQSFERSPRRRGWLVRADSPEG